MKHGSTTSYKRHGCRCDICRAATSKRSKVWRLQRLRGVEHLVDANQLRDHVAMLRAGGMSFKSIALSAGWSHRNGLAEAIKRPRVKPRTLARVLAVKLDSDKRRDAYVDATGSCRRLRALAVNGWSANYLAAQIGCRRSTVHYIRNGNTLTIRLRTKDAIKDLYDELWDQPGPSQRTANIAKGRGWLPALAWDDDLIDRPEHEPADVRRRGISGGGSGLTIEDIKDARSQGYESAEQIGWRLGVTRDAVQQILSRSNRLAS